MKKLTQLTEKEHTRRCIELKENAKKQKGVINWKKSELKKLFEWSIKSSTEWTLNFRDKNYRQKPVFFNLLESSVTNRDPDIARLVRGKNLNFAVNTYIGKSISRIYLEHVNARLMFEGGYKRLVHQITPKNLLGHMWYQLARSYELKNDYRVCDTCSSPFVARAERGKKRRFCSDKCKSKNWRDGLKDE